MSESAEWDQWLAAADSVATVPSGFDNDAALIRLEGLQWRLVSALPAYAFRPIFPAPPQDTTGLVCLNVYPGDADLFSPTSARIVLSRFGDLATARGCRDRELLATIIGVLNDFGLRYIPYDYLIRNTYDGKCKALVGTTLEHRYFALMRPYNRLAQ